MRQWINWIFILFLISISILLLIIFLPESDTVKTGDSWTYKIIHIDDMTCIKWENDLPSQGGLTCNWDEWKGDK